VVEMSGFQEPRPEFDYIIFKENDTCYAMDGKTGSVVSGTIDSAIIQNALNSITTGSVFIAPGDYYIDSAIQIGSNKMLEGSNGTTFHLVEGKETDIIRIENAERITIRNLTINGHEYTQSQAWAGIRIGDNVRYVRIENCRIIDMHGIGIYLFGSSIERNIITHNEVISNRRGIMLLGAGLWNNEISGNIVIYNEEYGIQDTSSGGEAGGNRIIGNLVSWNGWSAIALFGAYQNNNEIIANNYCEYNGHHGILAEHPGVRTAVIIGNIILNNYQHGVCLRGTEYCQIIGNLILGSGKDSTNTYSNLYLEPYNGSGGRYNPIALNMLKDNPWEVGTQKYGIFEDSGCQNNIFCYNIVLSGDTAKMLILGSGSKVYSNYGFTTESSGEATITAGNTYVDVSHGLDITPDINKIRITPKDNLNGRDYWISDVNSSTFRINISSSDSVDHTFGWSYYN